MHILKEWRDSTHSISSGSNVTCAAVIITICLAIQIIVLTNSFTLWQQQYVQHTVVTTQTHHTVATAAQTPSSSDSNKLYSGSYTMSHWERIWQYISLFQHSFLHKRILKAYLWLCK